jgi:hypothetical protein
MTLKGPRHQWEGWVVWMSEALSQTQSPSVMSGAGPRGMLVVAVPLVLLLGLYEGSICLGDSRGNPVMEFVNQLHLRTWPIQLEPHPGELAGDHHKQDLLCRRVDVVVVGEFSGQEELIPVILLVVSEKPDVLLHLLVDALSCLQIVWRQKVYTLIFRISHY